MALLLQIGQNHFRIHHKRTVDPDVVSRKIGFSLQLPVVYGWRHTMISHVSALH